MEKGPVVAQVAVEVPVEVAVEVPVEVAVIKSFKVFAFTKSELACRLSRW